MGLIDSLKSLVGLQTRSSYSLRDPALVALFGGHESESGVVINENTALNTASVWAAVRVISEGVASLPLILYQRDEAGRKRAEGHPLFSLLHNQPAPNVPSFAFRETLMGHVLLWGNAYAEIERSFLGRPQALHILRPDWMNPQLDAQGQLFYEYRHPQHGTSTLAPKDVFHIRGLGFDGLVGYSPVHLARESMGLAQAAERFGAKLFGSACRPSGVLEHPGALSDDAAKRLRQEFERTHSGISNAHRVVVLEEGMKWQSLGFPPEEAQFLQTRQYQTEEVARWFNLPLSKLRAPGANYSSMEAENLVFLTETLRPWLIRWEQEIWSKLLLPFEQDGMYAEHLVEGILRADQASRFSSYAIGRNWGWLSVNEIRARENMDPVPGGDVYLQPLNMQPLEAPQGPSAPTATPAVGAVPLPPTQPVPTAGASDESQPEQNDLPAVSEAVQALADAMTMHQITACEHGKTNRCPICGVRKERELVPPSEPGGEHGWKFKWVPIQQGRALPVTEGREAPAKYSHIDFTPPDGVREEAKRGLEWRKEYNRGGTAVGVARARDLSNGVKISPETAKRMYSYFARHEVDKKGEGWKPGQDGFPSAGRIAWALWGGDAGEAWASKLVRQMAAADGEE